MKRIIDRWFKDNYNDVKLITKMHICRLGKNYDPEGLIAESYIYVLNKKPKDKAEIERLVYGFIWFELSKWNSKTNRSVFFATEELTDYEATNQNTDILLNIDIEMFEKTLDRTERILWDVYYHRGLQKKRELADHFNIDETSAWLYIKKIKDKYLDYAKSENRI